MIWSMVRKDEPKMTPQQKRNARKLREEGERFRAEVKRQEILDARRMRNSR